MLSINPGSDMTPVVHKHLFDLGKYIHRKTRKTEIEGSRADKLCFCYIIASLALYTNGSPVVQLFDYEYDMNDFEI